MGIPRIERAVDIFCNYGRYMPFVNLNEPKNRLVVNEGEHVLNFITHSIGVEELCGA